MGARFTGLIVLLAGVIVALLASIISGNVKIPLHSVWDAWWAFDGSRDQLIIRTVRVPRAFIAAAVGGSLAVAGCLMQAISRNPLAGPELFGVNYGAALGAVMASFLLEAASLQMMLLSALCGALVAGALVLALGSLGKQPMTPVKLVLAGATLNLLFASLTQGILILNEQSLDTMRFWLAGSVTGRDLELLLLVLPYLIIGLVCGCLLGGHLNVISLGDDTARGLGQRVQLLKVASAAIIVLLAGSAVALAGPIAFVGLAVPHIVRMIVGSDYRWIIPYAAASGALLLLLADIGARFVIPGRELTLGVVTSFFGAPFLIWLVQRKGGAS